jgi:iron(III) transport system substrate-binding protein
MKRTALIVSFLALLIAGVAAMGDKEAASSAAAAPELSHDELVAAAKAEGKVVVYSITSRIANAAVEFEKRYGIKVEASNLKDGELIEKVTREVSGGIQGADFVICQDSGRVFGQLIATGYLVNYVPPALRTVIPRSTRTPLRSSS